MASTTAAALKAHLETQSLGVPIFTKRAPSMTAGGQPQARPYIVVTDGIGDAPQRTGNGRSKRTTELVQVDIYEDRKDESSTLAKDTMRALDNARLPTAPQKVWRTELNGRVRFDDPAFEVVRNTITIAVRRNL